MSYCLHRPAPIQVALPLVGSYYIDKGSLCICFRTSCRFYTGSVINQRLIGEYFMDVHVILWTTKCFKYECRTCKINGRQCIPMQFLSIMRMYWIYYLNLHANIYLFICLYSVFISSGYVSWMGNSSHHLQRTLIIAHHLQPELI